MRSAEGFAELMTSCPVGATVLGVLESLARAESNYRTVPAAPRTADVEQAITKVMELAEAEFLSLTVYSAYVLASPWMPNSSRLVKRAIDGASARFGIAEAVAARFGEMLNRPMDHAAQEWWRGEGTSTAPRPQPVWTSTSPDARIHADLVGAWELDDETITRWRLPVQQSARICEIHRPVDWKHLVERHSLRRRGLDNPTESASGSWAIAANGERVTVIELDWASVRDEYDGVRMSWAGLLTAEGTLCVLNDGSITAAQSWFSERTRWVNWVFSEPEPLAGPHIPLDVATAVDANADDHRQQRDLSSLRKSL